VRASVSLLVLVVLVGACSGGGSSDCADGFRQWQGSCIPVSDHDLTGGDWTRPDTPGPEPVEPEPQAVEEVLDVPEGTPEVDVTPDVPADVPDSDFVATGQVGSPCNGPNDCDLGLGCLGGWPGGYCTLQECTSDGACPEGSACFALAEGFKTCVDLCTDSGQCRTAEGYRCKVFDDGTGEPVKMCYATSEGAGGTGAPCEKHEDCGGDLQCLFSFPYGYCARAFCSEAEPCADGECVRLNGVPTCLKGCASTDDCKVAGVDFERVCTSARTVANVQVKVCLTNVSGKALGEACRTDFECDTGLTCRIVSRGRCALGTEPCLSDTDCPRANDFCIMGEAAMAGLCTQSCSASKKCPAGTSQCVSHDGVNGTCLPSCFNANLCPGDGVMSCVYGDPLYSSTGDAIQACDVVYLGDPGAPCAASSECEYGTCLLGSGGTGYCTAPCPQQLLSVCPFPMACATSGASKRCYLRCDPTADDCPSGMTCQHPTGDPWVCLPL
jgi:hypothetical protein